MFHPDHCAAPEAHDIMAQVNAAVTTLSDPAARKKYDAQLRSTHSQCLACEGRGFTVRQRGFKGQDRVLCMQCKGAGWLVQQLKEARSGEHGSNGNKRKGFRANVG